MGIFFFKGRWCGILCRWVVFLCFYYVVGGVGVEYYLNFSLVRFLNWGLGGNGCLKRYDLVGRGGLSVLDVVYFRFKI